MLLAFFENDISKIALWIGIFGIILAGILVMLFTVFTAKRKNKESSDGKTSITDNEQNSLAEEQAYLEANDGRTVLSRNVIYSAGFDGQIRAGKYRMESTDKNADKFNVRLNGLVQEYNSGSVVILTDGDTISPVSGSIILSACED